MNIKPRHKKLLFILIVTLISFSILLVLISFNRDKSNQFILEGDQFFSSGQYARANQAYIKAELMWPPLFFNQVFQTGLKNIKKFPGELKRQPHISAFFKLKTSPSENEQLVEKIRQMSGVSEVRHMSSVDAYEMMKEKEKNHPNLVALLSPDILPASIEIFLNDETQVDEIEKILQVSPLIDDVSIRQDLSN